MVSNLRHVWYGDNLAQFRNKKSFLISKVDVSICPSVILELLVSYQRSLVIPTNKFWYLQKMTESTYQWYWRFWCHLGGEKWSSAWFNCFVRTQFQPFCSFCTRIYTFPTEFFGYGSKLKNISFYTGVYKITTGEQAKSGKKMGDKMKKKTVILLIKAASLVNTG